LASSSTARISADATVIYGRARASKDFFIRARA